MVGIAHLFLALRGFNDTDLPRVVVPLWDISSFATTLVHFSFKFRSSTETMRLSLLVLELSGLRIM